MPMLGKQALVRVPHTQRTRGGSLHYLLQGPSIQITAKVASLSTYKILCYFISHREAAGPTQYTF